MDLTRLGWDLEMNCLAQPVAHFTDIENKIAFALGRATLRNARWPPFLYVWACLALLVACAQARHRASRLCMHSAVSAA